MAAAAALLLPMAWAYSTSTTYCYDDVLNNLTRGCPETWPETPCTPDSGTTLCKCRAEDVKGTACLIDEFASSATTGRCAEVVVKVTSTTPMSLFEGDHVGGDSADGTPEITETIYCQMMVNNDGWEPYTRSGAYDEDDADFTTETDCWWVRQGWWGGYWFCWGSWQCWWNSGTTWENDKCYDNDRYLGEYCSDELNCNGADASYDEYSTSCLDNECCTYAEAAAATRPQCDCNWFDWWIGFACASDTCNGHACVFTTGGGGGYFCDYATEQGGPVQWFR